MTKRYVCDDVGHLAAEVPVRDLAALVRVCVELDECADAMRGDLTEAERALLDQLRVAIRRVIQ